MNKSDLQNMTYVSPLEVRHYILDIPVTKSKYQYNAVKFALRSLYPGNEDSTIIDYVIKNKTLIGIAANTERIERLKENNKELYSPALIICQIVRNGIAFYAGNGWMELQIIENGVPQLLQVFSANQIELGLQTYFDLCEKYNFSDLQKELYVFDSINNDIIDEFEEHSFKIKNVNDYINKIKLTDALIFIRRKNKKKSLPILAGIIFLLTLSIIDFTLYEKSRILKKELNVLQNTYQIKKKEHLEKKAIIESEMIEEKYTISVYDIFIELCKSSQNMKILTFSMNENNIKFEAENSSALNVLEQLSKSQIFEEVVLHQSVPQKDGTERFVISAKIIK